MSGELITIREATVEACMPEGMRATMAVPDLVKQLNAAPMDSGELILPDGVKCMIPHGRSVAVVHQIEPKVHSFKWIADDSPVPYGEGATYRIVHLAQPYILIIATFEPTRGGRLCLTNMNECFYRTAPLKSLDDELLYPALLNCSKFPVDGEDRPLSWICTQHVNFGSLSQIEDVNHRLRTSLKELLHMLLEVGFNYSSEHHEGSSWFTASRGVDPRVSTVDEWQKATDDNRLFVLDVPWLSTGKTVRQIVERMFSLRKRRTAAVVQSARDIARIVFNGTSK